MFDWSLSVHGSRAIAPFHEPEFQPDEDSRRIEVGRGGIEEKEERGSWKVSAVGRRCIATKRTKEANEASKPERTGSDSLARV